MIRVALGKYNNEGLYVTSKWLELPADEIEEYENWFIYEVETDIEGLKGGKYTLDVLNDLAERLER